MVFWVWVKLTVMTANDSSLLFCITLKVILHINHVSNVKIVLFFAPWPILSFSSIVTVSCGILKGESLYVQRCGSTLKNQRGREPFSPSVCWFVLTQVAVGWPAAAPFLPKALVFIETSALLASCRQEYKELPDQYSQFCQSSWAAARSKQGLTKHGPLLSPFYPLAGPDAGLARFQQSLGWLCCARWLQLYRWVIYVSLLC